jgi:transposase
MMHHCTEASRQKEGYSGVTQLGVDETSTSKGHVFVSLFDDLEKRRTIFVAEGKNSPIMAAFTEDFKIHHRNPHISNDRSPAFSRGVERYS